MSETAAAAKPKDRTQMAIGLDLHALLVAKATAEGRVLRRMVEDKLWELFPEQAPEHVKRAMGVLL